MDAMDYVLAVVALLAGLGAFLFGFKVLSDNIEKLATNRLRSWFDKTGKSRLAGVGIGAGVTAIIQSSSATTVMVVGFVNVGIMSLYQATSVIMGANIGTTITAHIASLQSINVIGFVTVLTCVGVFMEMLSKNEKVKTVGLMLAGLGLVEMEGGAVKDEVGAGGVDAVALEVAAGFGDDFGVDASGGLAHNGAVGVDVDAFLGVLREGGEFVGDGLVQAGELAGGDFVFKLDGVRETEGDPEGDFGLEPSGEEFGFVGALAVDFDDVEFFAMAEVEGLQRGFENEADPAEFGAANALHAE